MAKTPTKSPNKIAARSAPRGGGIGDMIYEEDFALRTTTFKVDTFIRRRTGKGGNEAEFDQLIEHVKDGNHRTSPAALKQMIDFLDKEVDSFGTPSPDARIAKNMFRAALGAPFLPTAKGSKPKPKKSN